MEWKKKEIQKKSHVSREKYIDEGKVSKIMDKYKTSNKDYRYEPT